ncbi:hypothetical protein RB195_016812 [Necator americanus]|uniref:Uncharacterized protein n=1 Tax=Necator americanus TaxID=51031 RepID=A0ABR1C298_NECAM
MVQNWCKANFPDFISFDEWPGNFSGLIAIEYSVWSILEAKRCSKPHQSVDYLKKPLQREWDELNAPFLRVTVDAFSNRLKACIHTNGGILKIKMFLLIYNKAINVDT